MAKSEPAERPLSPHLQVYRWPVTMATSITHRMTGVANAAGMVLIAWWLIALATGPEAFALVQEVMAHWLGRLVLFGFTWSISYHLLNGIRHLFWDAGKGYSLAVSNATGWLVFFGSAALAIAIWVIAYWLMGAF